jgi:hypothetical protein
MTPELEIGKRYFIAYTHGSTLSENSRTLTFIVASAGRLSLPSGRIVACDPLTAGRPTPFIQTVLPGRYTVDLSLARREDGVEFVAMARLKFTNRKPAVWVMALLKGQNPATLSDGGFFGYYSESGTGSFLDADAVSREDFLYSEDIDSLLVELTGNFKPHRYWLDYPIDRRLNMVMFSSGEGEGSYPSYFGIDNEGDICTLVTDFRII